MRSSVRWFNYAALSAADTALAAFRPASRGRIVTKPLLMPVLSTQVSQELDGLKESTRKFLRSATFFSGWGDVLLLRDTPTAFIWGLRSFFTAHLSYFGAFVSDGALLKLKRHPVLAGAGAAAGLTMAYQMGKKAGPLRAPVTAYAACITAMAILGTATGRRWVGPGAGLFVISDSVLWAREFLGLEGRVPDGVVMATYTLGQGLIVYGFTRGKDRIEDLEELELADGVQVLAEFHEDELKSP